MGPREGWAKSYTMWTRPVFKKSCFNSHATTWPSSQELLPKANGAVALSRYFSLDHFLIESPFIPATVLWFSLQSALGTARFPFRLKSSGE